MLVLQGLVVTMRDGPPTSAIGAVYVGDDGLIVAVTRSTPSRRGLPLRRGWRPAE
jgi:hypothetical protein